MYKPKATETPVVERWGVNERHYRKANGGFVAIIGGNLNYKAGGKWKKAEDFIFTGTSDADDLPVKITKRKVKIGTKDFKPAGLYLDDQLIQLPNDVDPVFYNNIVTYENIYDGIDLKYYVTPHKLREEYIIKSNILKDSTIDGSVLKFKYNKTGKLDEKPAWATAGGKSISVFSGSDFKGIDSRALFLGRFPIVVDPTTSPIPSSDAYINLQNGNTYIRSDSGALYIGSATDSSKNINKYRSYVRFNLSAMTSYTINSASFYGYFITHQGTSTLRQSSGEVDPETGTASTVYDNANGTSIGNFGTGTGWKNITVTTYVNTHKGGYCDFGITSSLEDSASGAEIDDYSSGLYASESSTDYKPYLYVDYTDGGGGTNIKINIGDTWKNASAIKINIGDSWKTVSSAKINIGDTWKNIF